MTVLPRALRREGVACYNDESRHLQGSLGKSASVSIKAWGHAHASSDGVREMLLKLPFSTPLPTAEVLNKGKYNFMASKSVPGCAHAHMRACLDRSLFVSG